jgi:mannose-1-phosphate guanylyltransferase
MARQFIASGEFFWNAGIFVWTLPVLRKAYEDYLPTIADTFLHTGLQALTSGLEQVYSQCESISIDHGIMEKADNVYVSLGDFGWSDLGTWGSLYDLSEKDDEGNVTLKCHTQLYDSKNNIVVLPSGKLAVIAGMEGYLIAESDNVLLICPKDQESAIRKYVNDAQIRFGNDFI